MFVRKFEGDSLEEALREVKRELGPDAIILKTLNNKGLKGAFKKKRFEITAAISENNYIRKAKVDSVLTPEQKNQFYNSEAGHINKMINNFSGNKESKKSSSQPAPVSYGNIGLNKVVQSLNKSTDVLVEATNKTANRIKTSLDEFLNIEEEPVANYTNSNNDSEFENAFNEEIEIEEQKQARVREIETPRQMRNRETEAHSYTSALPKNHREEEVNSSLKAQQQKINFLEDQLFELTRAIQATNNFDDNNQIADLRKTLKTLDIDESIIQILIKKAQFELSKDELKDQDMLFEFALRQLNSSIKTGAPMYAKTAYANLPVMTVFVSEVSSGQTSMIYKLAKACDNSLVISFNINAKEKKSFTEMMLDLNVAYVSTIGEAITACKKAAEQNKKVFIDYRPMKKETDETKKFIESLKRSFDNVETIISISAIHSEIFNRKIISKYLEISKKVTISHMDLCLSFGSLVNIQSLSEDLEFLFYGTGTVIPQDYETATSERILSGMFQF